MEKKRLPAFACRIFTLMVLFSAANLAFAATTERPDAELRQILANAILSSDSFKDRFDAEVWLVDMSSRLQYKIEDDHLRLELLKNIHYEATRAELPPELVLAVINVESNFDRWAISSAGARGLMQIMPFWLKEIGDPEDNLFDMRTNLRFGCTILAHYLKKERGDLRKALARYNGSIGKAWYSERVYQSLRTRWYKR
jgi:soluble lytic murein transglycosylase-like protein